MQKKIAKPTIALVNEDLPTTFNQANYNLGKSFVDSVSNDGKQMSEGWIDGKVSGRDRLAEAVGRNLAEEIRGTGYGSELVKVNNKGLISGKLLDGSGKVVK